MKCAASLLFEQRLQAEISVFSNRKIQKIANPVTCIV